MSALAPALGGQALGGLALVMGFALLCIRQVRAASALLAIQAAATAGAAVAGHQPLLAAVPLLAAAGIGFAPNRWISPRPRTLPVGGLKPATAAAAVLAVLCQSQGVLALPLSVVLLGVLLAATRQSAWMGVIALAELQNGIALGGSFTSGANPLLALACCMVPLPLGLGLVVRHQLAQTRPDVGPRVWRLVRRWLPALDLAVSLLILAGTVVVPLAPLSAAFAPLLALDGAFQSYARRNKTAMTPLARGLALATSTLIVLAACPSQPIAAWLAVAAAIGTYCLPTLRRRPDSAVTALAGAGILLFGLSLLATQPTMLAWFCLFAGIAGVAAVVPDLAVPLAILLLRLATQTAWPAGAETLGLLISLAALAACAVGATRRRSLALSRLAAVCVAVVALCLGTADGRFAALVLLTLLILSQAAVRTRNEPAAALAGFPPLGIFPGLVLVTLAVAAHDAWLLLPLGAAFIPILLAARPATFSLAPSVSWLPLGFCLVAGYFAPEGLVHWWHLLTVGQG